MTAPRTLALIIRKPRRGIALVLVLGVLVIVSILVIGLLTSARVNLATSRNYSSGNDVRLLYDTVINLAIAQIKKGTSGQDLAWISQPGLIRTFSPNGQAGGLQAVFLLCDGGERGLQPWQRQCPGPGGAGRLV